VALSIDARGSIAILRGPWLAEYLPEFERAKPTRLIVYAAPDLEFLTDLPPLLGLEVHHLPLADIRPIEMQPSLQTLSINAYFKVGIDFSALSNLVDLHLDWGPGADTIVAARSLEELSVNRFPGTDLTSLRPLTRLRNLRLAGGRKLATLNGIEAFSALEELRLLDLRALSDIDAVSGVADSLWSLEFDTCRRINRLDALASLRRLTRLLVINCGEIESLEPIAQLPLKVLHFYESTNIRDGRLDVLFELPDLADTSFANRRHYSHTREAIQAAISGRA
jgi:hypothetical protein